MKTASKSPAPRPALSRWLIAVLCAVFAAGLWAGWLNYEHRTAAHVVRVPGTNAWWQQAGVAAVTGLLLGLHWWRRRNRRGDRFVFAPLSRTAAARVGLLARPANFGRALAASPLLLLFLYGFFRAGLQVTSGLDPSDTVNAWGGPTYAGAMACHYLDLFLILMVVVWLLDRLLPAARRPATPAPSGGQRGYDAVRAI